LRGVDAAVGEPLGGLHRSFARLDEPREELVLEAVDHGLKNLTLPSPSAL